MKLMDERERRYYNSMLKVISWYKIILNFGLVKAKWRVDFVNEMTFKPRKANQSTQLLFSLEWEKKIEFDLPGGAAAGSEIWKTFSFSMKLPRWERWSGVWLVEESQQLRGWKSCAVMAAAHQQTNTTILFQQNKRKGVQLFFAAVN